MPNHVHHQPLPRRSVALRAVLAGLGVAAIGVLAAPAAHAQTVGPVTPLPPQTYPTTTSTTIAPNVLPPDTKFCATYYDDANGNGVQDAGEKVRVLVDVTLAGPSGTPDATKYYVKTAADGKFCFSNLFDGAYTLSFADDPKATTNFTLKDGKVVVPAPPAAVATPTTAAVVTTMATVAPATVAAPADATTADGTPLAVTGSSDALGAALGLLAVGTGAALVTVQVRRRPARD